MAIYFRRWTRMKNIDKVKLFYDLEVGETPPEIEVFNYFPPQVIRNQSFYKRRTFTADDRTLLSEMLVRYPELKYVKRHYTSFSGKKNIEYNQIYDFVYYWRKMML